MVGTIFGLIAIITWGLSVQMKAKKDVLMLQNIANLAYTVQYVMIGAYSAAAMNFTSVIRGTIYRRNEIKQKSNSKLILIIFVVIILILGVLTYNGVLSIYPIIATLIYTITTWMPATKWLRIMFVVLGAGWIYYNFNVGAFAPLIGNVFEVISGVIGIMRNERKICTKEKE